MIIDEIKNAALYYGIHERISTALKYLENNDLSKFESGKYNIESDDIFVIVQNYNTKPLAEGQFEAHKKYIDIQYMIEGKEKMGFASVHKLKPSIEYDESKDIMFFEGNGDFLTVEKGAFVIYFPHDSHMPGIKAGNSPAYVKKAVFKIAVN